MAEKYRETDYLYGSARVRALENQLIGKERLDRMLEASDSAAVMTMLSDHGVSSEQAGVASREDGLLRLLAQGYEELSRMTEGRTSPVDFLRYPYDCNNIKSLIKCFSKGIPAEELLFDSLGTLTVQTVQQAFHDKDYRPFPPHMAAAIPAAEESFSQTGNPQTVDLILDAACYADMLASAKESGIPLAVRLVETKIDLTNLMTCLRLLRMKLGAAGASFLSGALLSGGSLPKDLFGDSLSGGEATMVERLTYTRYAGFGALLAENGELWALEKWSDDYWMELAREAKFIPFGAEVLIGYAVALEYEIKNIRILLAGKDAELPSDVIRERLRKSYV